MTRSVIITLNPDRSSYSVKVEDESGRTAFGGAESVAQALMVADNLAEEIAK